MSNTMTDTTTAPAERAIMRAVREYRIARPGDATARAVYEAVYTHADGALDGLRSMADAAPDAVADILVAAWEVEVWAAVDGPADVDVIAA